MIGNGNLGLLVSVSDRAGVVSEAGFVLAEKQQTEQTGGVISKRCISSQAAVILKNLPTLHTDRTADTHQMRKQSVKYED